MALVPQATGNQAASVLHIKVVLVDADRNLTPVPRHALLISDNPASAPPRLIVTAVDGTADVRLRPGNYTIESDRPVTFHGKAYEWRQTVDVVAGRDSALELTAANAEVSAAASTPAATEAAAGGPPPLEADPAFLLPKWQDSVVAVWTPTNRVSGFVVDGMGLIVTNQRVIGADVSVEVQLTPTVKVAGTVLAADQAHDTSVIWIDPNTIASVKPVDLGCTEAQSWRSRATKRCSRLASPLRGPKAMATGSPAGLTRTRPLRHAACPRRDGRAVRSSRPAGTSSDHLAHRRARRRRQLAIRAANSRIVRALTPARSSPLRAKDEDSGGAEASGTSRRTRAALSVDALRCRGKVRRQPRSLRTRSPPQHST